MAARITSGSASGLSVTAPETAERPMASGPEATHGKYPDRGAAQGNQTDRTSAQSQSANTHATQSQQKPERNPTE